MSQQPNFSTYGAVDLAALRPNARSQTPPPGGGEGSGSTQVLDVTEATFQAEVLDRSMSVPVVIDLWATWCGPCKQLSPILERFAAADGGSWVLAKIDVDANQRLSAAFGVQSIPTTFAVIKGQLMPLFQGAIPEAQVRRYLDEVLRVAAEQGLSGGPGAPEGDAPPSAESASDEPPELDEAFDAIERGDLDAAATAYRKLLDRSPADEMARLGLAQVELMRRIDGKDPGEIRRNGDAKPDDVQAQTDAADLEVLNGDVGAAFERLLALVRGCTGAERDAARQHLLELFEIVGPEDPQVAKARKDLTNALF